MSGMSDEERDRRAAEEAAALEELRAHVRQLTWTFTEQGGVVVRELEFAKSRYVCVPDILENNLQIWRISKIEVAEPVHVRSIVLPRHQVCKGTQKFVLVNARNGQPTLLAPVAVERNTFLYDCGFPPAVGRFNQELVRACFHAYAEICPIIEEGVQKDEAGHIELQPVGVLPEGFGEKAEVAEEKARENITEALRIISAQRSGIAAVCLGAAIGSFFISSTLNTSNELQSHMIDVYGERGLGKSSILKIIAATIGRPSDVLGSMDATVIGSTEFAGALCYGFNLFDETQTSDFSQDAASRFVQRVVGRSRRLRAKSDGTGFKRSSPFDGVTFCTGNIRLLREATVENDNIGLVRRYFPVEVNKRAPVFDNPRSCDTCIKLMFSAYGHFLPLVLASITHAEFMDLYSEVHGALSRRVRLGLEDQDLVLHVWSLWLTGCRVADQLFGSTLEQAAYRFIDWYARNYQDSDSLGLRFFNVLHEYMHTHPSQFVTRKESLDSVNRGRGGANGLVHSAPQGVGSDILGVRDDADTGVLVYSKKFADLCDVWGFADSHAVVKSLDAEGLLYVTPSYRAMNTFVHRFQLAKGKQTSPGYYIKFPDGVDVTEPVVTTEDDNDVVLEEDEEGAWYSENEREEVSAYKRDDWLPDPIEFTVNKKKEKVYKGTINTWNILWKQQQHPNKWQKNYPHDMPWHADKNNMPKCITNVLVSGRSGYGLYTHEGYIKYVNFDIPKGTIVTHLDIPGAYLDAMINVQVPIGKMVHVNGRGDLESPGFRPGFHHIEKWPDLLVDNFPHPWGALKLVLQREPELWVTTRTLDLGLEMWKDGLITEPVVLDSWVSEPIKEGVRSYTRLWYVGETLHKARQAAIAAGDEEAEGFIRGVYSAGMSSMSVSNANPRIYRPDIPPIIRSESHAALFRTAFEMREAGLQVAAVRNTDAVHVVGTPDEIFKKIKVKQGRGLGQLTVKKIYAWGEE